MNIPKTRLTGQAPVLLVTAALFFASGLRANAQGVPHLNLIQPGGMPGLPIMTGIERTSNGVSVTWDGPSGYYQLFKKLGLADTWHPEGGPNLSRNATITTLFSNAFFRVSGSAPQYAGSQACLECHENIHAMEMDTRHADAFVNSAFVAKGGQTNSSCLPCHTVGYGLPSGFVSKFDLNSNPRLAGVQCESCHGPAANHAANEGDLTVRPRAELAGQVCGGCHNEGSHRPNFEQWKTSGHFSVVEDMNPSERINSCGRCHSGSSRLALIKGENPSITVSNDANVGITCVVCHDPHANHTWTNALTGVSTFTNALTGSLIIITNDQVGAFYTNQLRHPIASTTDYFLATSDVFSNKYDPNINGCAQCHNHRGANWTSSSRPPHHSPQYNMLLGTVGELETGVPPTFPSTHSQLEKQCVGCHMPKVGDGSESHPAFSGHTFRADSYDSCRACHSLPEVLVMFATTSIAAQIQELKGRLDLWAMTKAPNELRTKFGALAWEYTTPGELSSGGPGPSSSEQNQIPDNIKKARFNLYLVKYDGSFGVHNGPLAVSLLEAARNWIQVELNQ
jgi:nitrate/TMAO reductase-like tetraheme cytochrome c subunit